MPKLSISLILVSIWIVIYIIDKSFQLNEKTIITCLFLLGIIQIVFLLKLLQKHETTSINGGVIFFLCSLFFIYTVPFLSTFISYSYILTIYEQEGIKNLLKINFWSNNLFFIGYSIIKKRSNQITLIEKKSISFRHYILITTFSLIGLLSFLETYSSFHVYSATYEEIGSSLEGQNWTIRLAELLGVSGIFAILLGEKFKKKWLVVYGWAVIALFALLRYPFQNRENVIKYFFIAFVAIQMLKQRKISKYKQIILLLFSTLILLSFPFLSSLRGGVHVTSINDYIHFFVRDLNFAEIASSLLAHQEYDSKIGIINGITNTINMIIPREIWPDKGYTVAVTITSWLTPVYYNPDQPLFAYAPTYIGYAYVLGGYPFILVTAFFIGILSAHFSNSKQSIVDISLASVAIYYLTFASHKLDPGNILAAAIIPLLSIFSAKYFLKKTTL